LSDALAEGAPLTDTVRLLEKVAGETAVLCTHGDVIENVVNHLKATGVPLDDDRLEKGSIWVLDTRDGEIVEGSTPAAQLEPSVRAAGILRCREAWLERPGSEAAKSGKVERASAPQYLRRSEAWPERPGSEAAKSGK